MRRRPWQLMSALLAGLASACVGTSTGNPANPDPEIPNVGEASGGSCDETKTKLASLDAESPLGFSAADILALANDHAQTPFEWLDRDGVTFAPESGMGTLTVDVEPRSGGEAHFVDRSPKSSGNSGGPEIAIGSGESATACPDTVDLDVTVQLTTAGGAFDERFDATLRAKGPNVARIYASRKAAELEGSFEASLDSDPSAVLESVQFDLTFSKLGQSGQLGVGLKRPEPAGSNNSSSSVTSSAINPGPVAQWPASTSCTNDPISGSGFGARVDQAVDQFSVKDGVDRFNATKLQLTGAGAAATKLSAQFAPSGSACAVLESSDFGPAQSLPTISVSGELTLRSDDNRIDGKWPMQLSAAAAADGSLGTVKVAYDLHGSIIASLVDAAVFESTYGIHGFDMTGYDEAGVLLTLTIGPDAAVRGELVVNGVKRPDCQTQPLPATPPGGGASTPGCAGLQFTPVWTAAIAAGN